MKHYYDLTTGSIPMHLLRLSSPLIVGNILQQLYNTVDAFILGHFAGNTQFAAVGIAGSVMNLFLFMIMGACTGISVIFASLYGAGDYAAFRREHWISLTIGTLTVVLFSILGLFCLPYLLSFIRTPKELLVPVSTYLSIILINLFASFLYNLYSALLRAIGRTSASLMALAAAVSVNLVLDFLFVAKFAWGIAGAAYATAISQIISAGLCILYLVCKAPNLVFRRKDCHMDKNLLLQTTRFSFITGLLQSSLYIGKLLIQGAVNTGGTDMISAYTATTRIEGFANSFGDSGSSATSVLVAQNYGAGKKGRVRNSFRSSFFLLFFIGVVMSVVMYVSAAASVGLMLGSTQGKAFENACSYMKIVAFFYVFCFLGNSFAGYFDGIGKVLVPFTGSLTHITLRVILSWLLIKEHGLPAVALATGLGWILVNVLWSAIYLRCRNQK